jgi:hypothetical protein
MRRMFSSIIVLAIFCGQADSQIQVTFSGDTTRIWDANVEWWCGARFDQDVFFKDHVIRINEVDTVELATCTCYYTLCTTIVGLSPGTYTVQISRQVWVHHQGTSQVVSTGMLTFTTPNLSPGPITASYDQSPCSETPSAVVDREGVPASSVMIANYPNPFNPSTVIRYSVPYAGHATVAIHDLRGRQVALLVDGTRPAGVHEFSYDAGALASGMYICRLTAAGQVLSTKMVVVK